MNKKRLKSIKELIPQINELRDKVNSICSSLQILTKEEQMAYEKMPDNHPQSWNSDFALCSLEISLDLVEKSSSNIKKCVEELTQIKGN